MKLRRIPKAKKECKKFSFKTAKKGASNRLWRAVSVLGAGLMLTGSMAKADEKSAEKPKKELKEKKEPESNKKISLRLMGGAYDSGETPFVGVGITGSFDFKHVVMDVIADGIFSNFKEFELDHAELDLTFPAEPVAITAFVFSSRYYWTDLGAGAVLHIPQADLHIAPQWFNPGNGITVPVSYTPSFAGGKVGLTIGVVPVLNYFEMGEPAPIVGGEFRFTMEIAKGLRAYLRVFEMTLKDGKKLLVGTLNAQGGLEADF